MSKARTKVVVLLGALGVSLLGALAAPAVASADPWYPYWTGPEHPVRHRHRCRVFVKRLGMLIFSLIRW